MSSALYDFRERLYSALFDRMNIVFPVMKFAPYRGGWASPLKLNGTPPRCPRKDKCIITSKVKHRILEQGGESVDLITFYKGLYGIKEDMAAIKEIAQIIGLQLPEDIDSESYRQWKEKQEGLEKAAIKMKSDLYTDGGRATLNYLKGRGYDDDFISYAEFGYCSPETARTLSPLFSYTGKDGQRRNGLPYGVGDSYVLAFPYRSGSKILGFIFRHLNATDGDKYRDAFISAKASKKYHLFGLTSLSPIGAGEWDKTITIVEGEIDALRAQYAGCTNVVAASGGCIYTEALTEAKKIGATGVNILFDRGEQGTDKKIAKAIDTIKATGLTPYVITLPQQADEKVDPDSFINAYGGEAFVQAVKDPQPASLWKFDKLASEMQVIEQDTGQITYPNFEEFKRRTIALANTAAPVDRDMIFSNFSNMWEGGFQITKEAMTAEADRLKEMEDSHRQQNEATTLFSQAYQLAKDGKVGEAFSLLKEKQPDVERMSSATEFAKLLLLPTPDSIINDLKKQPDGIPTEFAFGVGDRRERFILPSGALTYICAPTSHGKSTLLYNLALQLLRAPGEGDVLFFTFEESREAKITDILNVYTGEALSRNNRRTIASHYRGKGSYFIPGKEAVFAQKASEFFNLLSKGKLRVYYEDYDSTKLIEAIRYLSRQIKVKAVFIDYIQLLRTAGSRLQRKDELQEICRQLMKLSIEVAAPFVLGAQLNREAYSPVEMTAHNIREAADIEHSANVVMLLWNSVNPPEPRSSAYYIDKNKGTLSREAQALASRGFTIGTGGKLYAKLAKNRGGEKNIDAVFDFDGNTGRITQPDYSPEQDSRQNHSSPFEPSTPSDYII